MIIIFLIFLAKALVLSRAFCYDKIDYGRELGKGLQIAEGRAKHTAMPLKLVLIDRDKLIAHGNWQEPLRRLLLGLYEYGVAVLDVSGLSELEKEASALSVGEIGVSSDRKNGGSALPVGGIDVSSDQQKEQLDLPVGETNQAAPAFPFADGLMIADCEESVRDARIWNASVLGYEPAPGRIQSPLPMIVEGFDEVDFYFLERVYQRYHHLPWTVIETQRCLLREVTLTDLDDLYRIYGPKEMTQYTDGLYEDRKKEEEYTKAYIEHMYGFFGYGLWLVVEKETGQTIGRAGLGHLEVEGEVQLELGYLIAKPKQRQGYATEVCLGILDYAKVATGFDTIHCLIQKENIVSVHLALKLGFQWEKSVLCNGKEMQRYSKILQS